MTLADHKPRTELGRKLLAIRKKIINSGVLLLSQDQIRKELTRDKLRGER